MNQKVLRTLEYYKIIDKLEAYATSTPAKELCRNLTPSSDLEEILKTQSETSDALRRVYRVGSFSFSGIRDIRPSLKRLAVGSVLGMGELLAVSSTLDTAAKAKSSANTNTSLPDDSLDPYFSSLQPLTRLNNEIKRCILPEEVMDDNASPSLKDIRRRMHNVNERIHQQLTSMVSSPSTRTYLQEAVVTMRNGRYCLPVKQEHRSQITGMIHDQSSSGSTIFVEPMAVIKLNNDLRELEIKEQEEVERILADLSNQAATDTEALEEDYRILVQLDFIFAKASFAKDYKGSEPVFNQEGIIRLKMARHPLLDPVSVVPSDIHLGDDFDLMVITGPNTGGKTVSLKTVGLLTLMGQSGLHIPAFDGSRLAVFEEVYADIGDEQSIEQSLSTFSSHMTNIVSILDKADQNSLVLFDELCAGTDPTEGAALAASILTFLHNMKVRTIATTHYSELKVYALSSPGVINACCEFDVETLQPTYRLLIGIPGKSNAFAISGKLGLPAFIVDDAKKRINEQDIAFEDLVSNLETSRTALEKEREEAAAYKAEAASLKQQLEQKQGQLQDQRERLLREANEEARTILQEAKEYADEVIRKFNKGLSGTEMEQARSGLRKKIDDKNEHLAYKSAASKKAHKSYKPHEFRPGDLVRVLSLNLNGTVTSLPNSKGEVTVQMGILHSQVNIHDLELMDEPGMTEVHAPKPTSGTSKLSKSATISSEINLIGKTVEEALILLDKYLDDAYLSHLSPVRVVHGKGTGALRQAVHGHLKRMKHVDSYRLGVFGEGDSGVTIVEFK